MKSPYYHTIQAICDPYDPRHIEAYMRLAYSTLDGLSRDQFRNEVWIGMLCVDTDGVDNAERLARSFNL